MTEPSQISKSDMLKSLLDRMPEDKKAEILAKINSSEFKHSRLPDSSPALTVVDSATNLVLHMQMDTKSQIIPGAEPRLSFGVGNLTNPGGASFTSVSVSDLDVIISALANFRHYMHTGEYLPDAPEVNGFDATGMSAEELDTLDPHNMTDEQKSRLFPKGTSL